MLTKTIRQQYEADLRAYCVVLIVEPRVASKFQRLEAVLCFICKLLLFKHHKELFAYRNSICRIKWDKGYWNTGMKNLRKENSELDMPSVLLAASET